MKSFYERYLKGISVSKAAKTLLGYAALLFVTLQTTMHATPERAAVATAIATALALPVYLVIPKPVRALVDNIGEELLLRQSDAAAIAAKLEQIIPISATSDGTNTTATVGDAPATATATVAPTPSASVPEADAPEANPTPIAAPTP